MKLRRQAGFSLTEVMFAVLILAMGLVFVACQFPVALSVCRDVVDNTREVVESHNSQMMIELKLREANLEMIVDRRSATFEPGDFHMLLKPNVLADAPNPPQPRVVLDDFEQDPLVMDYGFNFVYYLIHGTAPPFEFTGYGINNIDLPFWSQDASNLALPAFNPWTEYFLGDIGYTMSPPVDESDSQVQLIMAQSGLYPGDVGYEQTLNRAIYNVSLGRKYSWCAFYHEPENDNYNSIEYYIVTLRNSSRDVRYAKQTQKSLVFKGVADPLFNDRPLEWPIEGMVGDAEDDRLFPVPWRVFLDDIALNDTMYYWGGETTGLNPQNQPPAVFSVRRAVGMMLRTGSILIDADPPDLFWSYETQHYYRVAGGSGKVYEVAKVEPDPAYPYSGGQPTRYLVTLRTSLDEDDLFSFWFFPPPVLRDGSGNFIGFDDFQPVVNVTKKIIKFD
ncbi:MAG: prepilin-type N-terminal cleavage/methylation domain-containing protein [Sedimentisphaerales bacterium]|nr:prepilin-type N-terminal cleavage/methylation domain-containing protein [Sedimentisphaerales bacterium]